MKGNHLLRLALATALSIVLPVSAQYAYPAKGQSADQQKKDEGECHTWAVGQTKYDPANPPAAAPVASGPATPRGSRAKGAAAGAIIGEATTGNASGGAAAGMVAGGVAGRNAKRQADAQQQQASSQQNDAGMAAYQKARGACLEGKGYTVK